METPTHQTLADSIERARRQVVADGEIWLSLGYRILAELDRRDLLEERHGYDLRESARTALAAYDLAVIDAGRLGLGSAAAAERLRRSHPMMSLLLPDEVIAQVLDGGRTDELLRDALLARYAAMGMPLVRAPQPDPQGDAWGAAVESIEQTMEPKRYPLPWAAQLVAAQRATGAERAAAVRALASA